MGDITSIEDSHNIANTYKFIIFMTEKKVSVTKRNLTKQEADEQAWKWLNLGVHETIGKRIVCCDAINVNLVEIKKLKG